MSEKAEVDGSNQNGFWIATSIFSTVIVLWLCTPFIVEKLTSSSWSDRGQFGDLFGSVNSLFSGLAFAALIYTIYLQRQELALQRIELKLQRDEMVASRGELAAQVAVQKALYQATIAQIKVSAEQVRMEAVNADSNNPYTIMERKTQINSIASKIDEIAYSLEKTFQ